MSTMTLAPAVSTRRVRGRALTPDGKPALGLVEFISTLTQTDKPDNVTIVDGKITAPVNPSNGDWVITVPVTDDPDLTPGIKVYAVRIPGARSVRTITVPAATTDLRYVDALDSVIVPADMIGVALTGLTIGRVTTLAPGSLGTAELVGGAPAPELNLGIPQGPQGDRPTVELGTVTTGEPGSTAAITWSGVGSVASPYKLNFTIPRGDVGAQGPQPIVRTGTVTKIAPGGNPTADMTGTGTAASPYTLALGLVTGDKGDKGDKGDAGAAGISNLNDPGVTGTLPISKGGTGATNATAARTALGIFQAKYAYFRSYQSSFVGSPRLAAFSRQTTGGAPADSSYSTPATANSRAGAITINETGLYAISASWKASGEMGAATFGNIGVATQSAVDGAAGANRAVYPSECSMYTIGARSSDNTYISAAMSGVYLTAGLVLELPTYNASSARSLEVLVTIAKVG